MKEVPLMGFLINNGWNMRENNEIDKKYVI